jgi:hypothetical protein
VVVPTPSVHSTLSDTVTAYDNQWV